MYNRNNRRGMSRRSSYRITAANNVEKAIALLLSAEYTTSKNDDVYDFLYGSWSMGEAEQLADERKVVQALKHYENLEPEMDYKSRKLNEGLRGRRSASSYRGGYDPKGMWREQMPTLWFAITFCALSEGEKLAAEFIQRGKFWDEIPPAHAKKAYQRLKGLDDDMDKAFEEFRGWYFMEYGDRPY